jgi:hypothetical protein
MIMLQTELWLTPLILLPGVALLIMSTSTRLGQISAEFHHLIDHPDAHAKIVARDLVARSALFRNALVGLYASVALFATGSFFGGILHVWLPNFVWTVGGLTLAGILGLAYAAVELVRESLHCTRIIMEHDLRVSEKEHRSNETP